MTVFAHARSEKPSTPDSRLQAISDRFVASALRRLKEGKPLRSSIHAGGTLKSSVITEEHLRLAEIVRPKVVQDGMFLVGLDIVGDKLMEINVFSPGGLGSAQKFERVNFAHAVIEAVERKVNYMTFYRRNFDNAEMASL